MKVSKMKVRSPTDVIFENDISELLKGKTKYRNMFIYPQSYTQRLLEEEINKVGIDVNKEVELTEIKNNENNVSVKFDNKE